MMRLTHALLGTLLGLAGAVAPADAQSAPLATGAVVYGHHHLIVTDVAAHKKFWIETLGGTPGMLATNEAAVFTNVIVLFRQGTPTGGSKGTSVNHVGFGVPDIRKTLDRLKAAGYPAITRAEMPPTQEVKDDLAFIANQNTSVAYVMAPDDVKVELVEVKTQATPVALHHIHYYTPQVDAMKAWYVKTFGAAGGMRGSFQAADLPGVNLTFSPAPDGVVPTKGRSFDHVGYEVKNLEAFCKALEAAGVKFDRPYAKNAAIGIGLAFFTDPFGTYIELTEGLGGAIKN